MMRKFHEDQSDNVDRWLVSYADFITLLLAFFIMLYGVSSLQEKKLQALSQSLGTALGMKPSLHTGDTTALRESTPEAVLHRLPPLKIDPIELIPMPPPLLVPELPHTLAEQALNQQQAEQQHSLLNQQQAMQYMVTQLEHNLAPLINSGKIHIVQSHWGISIEINASLLFAPGEAKLGMESRRTLQSIADVLQQHPYAIRVEGHTDDKPIRNPAFPSNWELSSARATGVVRWLIDLAIDSKRLSAVGYGDTHPVADNDTAEGRLRNRRVQLMILTNDNPLASIDSVQNSLPIEP